MQVSVRRRSSEGTTPREHQKDKVTELVNGFMQLPLAMAKVSQKYGSEWVLTMRIASCMRSSYLASVQFISATISGSIRVPLPYNTWLMFSRRPGNDSLVEMQGPRERAYKLCPLRKIRKVNQSTRHGTQFPHETSFPHLKDPYELSKSTGFRCGDDACCATYVQPHRFCWLKGWTIGASSSVYIREMAWQRSSICTY